MGFGNLSKYSYYSGSSSWRLWLHPSRAKRVSAGWRLHRLGGPKSQGQEQQNSLTVRYLDGYVWEFLSHFVVTWRWIGLGIKKVYVNACASFLHRWTGKTIIDSLRKQLTWMCSNWSIEKTDLWPKAWHIAQCLSAFVQPPPQIVVLWWIHFRQCWFSSASGLPVCDEEYVCWFIKECW